MRLHDVICVLSAFAVLLVPGMALAEMLDEPACNQLKNEQARLGAAGVQTEMLYGPDWAKANLPASRLNEIKRLMEVEEALNFRCPKPAPPKPVEPVAAAPADTGPESQTNTPRKKKAKKPANPDATNADPPAAELPTDSDQTDKPKKKAKAKKKKPPADDAYVPPAATGNALTAGEGEPVPQPPPQGPAAKSLSP